MTKGNNRMSDERLRAVIFDVDGTLVDSKDVHARSWVEALMEAGYAVTFDDVRRRIGMGGDNLLPDVIGKSKDSPEGKKVSQRRKEIFQTKYLPMVNSFADVPALFRRVQERGLKTAISSSSDPDDLEALLGIAGVKDLVGATTSSSDAKHSKPDPDPIEVALKKTDCSPAQAVMVGDTPYDIEAARKVGVRTIAVRCGGFSDDDLRGAIAIYDDPADLLAHFGSSPLGI